MTFFFWYIFKEPDYMSVINIRVHFMQVVGALFLSCIGKFIPWGLACRFHIRMDFERKITSSFFRMKIFFIFIFDLHLILLTNNIAFVFALIIVIGNLHAYIHITFFLKFNFLVCISFQFLVKNFQIISELFTVLYFFMQWLLTGIFYGPYVIRERLQCHQHYLNYKQLYLLSFDLVKLVLEGFS